MGIDLEKNFEPRYIIPEGKEKVVNELKSLAKKSQEVWLATDEDREYCMNVCLQEEPVKYS